MSAVSEQFFDKGFDGAEADEESADVSAEKEPESKQEAAKADESKDEGTAETKGETSKAAEPPTADADKDEDDLPVDEQRRVPLKVALVERKKRQELERQLAERDGELKVLRSRGQSQEGADSKEQPKELTEADAAVDPAAYTKQEVAKVVQAETQRRYRASEKRATKEFGQDLPKYVEAFREWASKDQTLLAKMHEDDDPVVFAATQGRLYLKTKDMGDPEEFEAKIRADERAKMEAERKRKESLATAKTTPTSTVSAKGAATTEEADDDEVDEPESIRNILKRKK